jgi:3-carboxy-cis,cis-muconate cycloisomerase
VSLALTFADEGCAEALSDERFLAAMARFEGALAQASAKAGVVPATDAAIIAAVCERASFEPKELAQAARNAGTLAIPFVKQLTAQVAAVSVTAARHVHFGATSQDVVDTALMLCLREAAGRLAALSACLGDATALQAKQHARAPMAARTLLQPALPIPFGWKAAVWLSLLTRAHLGLQRAAREIRVLQFGGAGGTLSAFGPQGDAIAGALAAELGLRVPDITWHSARDGIARFGAETAILAGAAGKIARDVVLLMQPEVGEASEPAAAGRGGSSSLPHKRNPAACLLALEAAQRTPGLASTLLAQLTPEHERGIGQWQSQWLTLRELVAAAGSATAAMGEVVAGLQVHTDAMRANLERSKGLVYSEAVSIRLARELGKAAAHALTEKLCQAAVRQNQSLLEAMRDDAEARRIVPEEELPQLFDPQNCFGSARPMIERALASWRDAREAAEEA